MESYTSVRISKWQVQFFRFYGEPMLAKGQSPGCRVSVDPWLWSEQTVSRLCLPALPHQGIQFLLENDLLQQTPEDIAQFLYKGEGLNKTVIGDYLGER